ncbi:MAG: DUF5071 domain-containing protein [Janthinobacterium lividum]
MNSKEEIWETPLYQMLQTLDSHKDPWQQLERLKKFDNLPPEQFDELTSGKYIKHEEAAIVMQYLPVEWLIPKLPSLLGHLMDGNWPASKRISDLLTSIGAPLLSEIKRVFQTDKNDGIWLNNIIRGIVGHWNNSLISELKHELFEVVNYAEHEGASISALEVLKRILPPQEFEKLYSYLKDKYANNTSLIHDLLYAFDR